MMYGDYEGRLNYCHPGGRLKGESPTGGDDVYLQVHGTYEPIINCTDSCTNNPINQIELYL